MLWLILGFQTEKNLLNLKKIYLNLQIFYKRFYLKVSKIIVLSYKVIKTTCHETGFIQASMSKIQGLFKDF